MITQYSIIKRAIKKAKQMDGFLTDAEKDNLIQMITEE